MHKSMYNSPCHTSYKHILLLLPPYVQSMCMLVKHLFGLPCFDLCQAVANPCRCSVSAWETRDCRLQDQAFDVPCVLEIII